MGWDARDVAKLAARAEANGRRQDPEFYEGLRAVVETERGQREGRESKFGNVRCEEDGIRFDSKAERRHYLELRLRERAGEISELRPSPEQPKKQRFVLAAGITYTPDFTYIEGGRRVADDVKGGRATATAHFKDKAKLFRERYPEIELRIVER